MCAERKTARNRCEAPTRSAERRLITIARAGDAYAFEELMRPYEGRTYTLLLRMLGSEADAADALQDTLFEAFDHLESFRGDCAFGTWLYRIAVNRALMGLRKRRIDPLRLPEALPAFDSAGHHAGRIEDWTESAESSAVRAEVRRKLIEAFEAIPEIDRAIVLLKDAVEGRRHAGASGPDAAGGVGGRTAARGSIEKRALERSS